MVNGQPIQKRVQWLPHSSIRYNSTTVDAVLTARYFGYLFFDDWQDLSTDEQAYLIALYRDVKAMEAYQAHEATKK
jgi:hypothetical protein